MSPFPEYHENDFFETDFQPFIDLPGFFPGAGGFFHGCNRECAKSIIFYGTDFGELSYQRRLAETGGEPETNKTIKNLKTIVLESGLNLNSCFLTNVVLGLTKGEEAVGNYESTFKRFPDYIQACAVWHREWLKGVMPKLVVLMGTPNMNDYGTRIFPELSGAWSKFKSLKDLYSSGAELIKIQNGPSVLLMYHPSYWHAHPADAKRRIIAHLKKFAN